MTDNEIIKVLARRADYNCDRCCDKGENCEGEDCEKIIAENILDFINRQEAEIKVLKARNNQLNSDYLMTKNDYDHVKALYEDEKAKLSRAKEIVLDNCKELKTAKSEAIKEFAERVKMAFYYESEECIPSSMAEKIDEIVKEITEGENESMGCKS